MVTPGQRTPFPKKEAIGYVKGSKERTLLQQSAGIGHAGGKHGAAGPVQMGMAGMAIQNQPQRF